MLVISDLINLTDLIGVLQKYLVEKRKYQLNDQFSLVHKTCFNHQSFKELQAYCDKICQHTPDIIFKAHDFTTLDKDLLIYLLENKRRLRLYEIQKWDHLIKWGMAQTPSIPFTFSPNNSSYDTSLWLREHFRDLSVTLKPMIDLINLKGISSKEFCEKVKPFKKILEKHHYDELLRYHLNGEDAKAANPLSLVAETFGQIFK